MSETNHSISNNENNNGSWKSQYLVGGAILGAVIGIVAAYFLVRTAEENKGGPPEISGVDILKSSVGVIGIIRGIASLGG